MINKINLRYFYNVQCAYLEVAGLLVITDQIVLVKYGCRGVDQVTAIALQIFVFRELVVGHAVQRWRPQHSYVEIRVT